MQYNRPNRLIEYFALVGNDNIKESDNINFVTDPQHPITDIKLISRKLDIPSGYCSLQYSLTGGNAYFKTSGVFSDNLILIYSTNPEHGDPIRDIDVLILDGLESAGKDWQVLPETVCKGRRICIAYNKKCDYEPIVSLQLYKPKHSEQCPIGYTKIIKDMVPVTFFDSIYLCFKRKTKRYN